MVILFVVYFSYRIHLNKIHCSINIQELPSHLISSDLELQQTLTPKQTEKRKKYERSLIDILLEKAKTEKLGNSMVGDNKCWNYYRGINFY